MRPRAREVGLLVRELPDETLVYDLERHRAHCLNRGAGLVFRLCDGERTSQEIAAALPAEAGAEGEREALVGLALAQLEDACLLAPAAGSDAPTDDAAVVAAGGSRRELLRRAGAALLLPAIASVLAPTPAQAATACVENIDCIFSLGQPCWCTTTSQCSSNTCVDFPDTAPTNIHCHPCDD